ncbi:MAG TPA: hypothetical protein VFM23_02120 [Gemmatimonadales bacterium]|nr:hypothetical protein [Gemmatimonadales bacterium]
MRIGKMMHRIRKNVPLFPMIPIIPALVVSDAVLTILNFRRLRRLDNKVRSRS